MLVGQRLFFLIAFLFLAFFALGFAQTCNNGSCEPGENSCSCPQDCGSCSGKIAGENCKEYACNQNNICAVTTIMNCCGNDYCETGESFSSCPADCLPEKLDFELLSPSIDENFFRGEHALFKVEITGEGVKILGAKAEVKGFFGSVELFNDSMHEDGNVFDAVYANRFLVGKDAVRGWHKIRLKANFRGVISEQDFNIFVEPRLEVELNAEKRYSLGDIIDLGGTVKRKSYRFQMPLNIIVNDSRKNVFDFNTSSDQNGLFFAQYHSSLIDSSGIWTVKVEGSDANNNEVQVEQQIEVLKAREEAFLEIGLLKELQESYERGTGIEVIATVKDFAGESVEGASVKLSAWPGKEIQLLELKPGQYSGIYAIPFDAQTGSHQFTVSASKSSEAGTFSGNKAFSIEVEKASIAIEIIEPSKRHYQIGENLAPEVFLRYGNEEPVVDAVVTALVGNTEIALHSTAAGLFSADYFLGEQDSGRIKVSFKAVDNAGNEGIAETRTEVSGISLLYTIQKNSLLIAIVLVVVVAAAFASRKFLTARIGRGNLLKRQQELLALQKELQQKYFREGSISKKDFKAESEKYETALEEVEKMLRELDKK